MVADEQTTSLWEPGTAPEDPRLATAALLERVEALLDQADVLVVSGSLPPGIEADLPSLLAARALRRGIPAVLDTSGAALRCGIEVPGVVIMPNSDELSELTGRGVDDLSEVASAAKGLLQRGVGAVIATRGAQGMVLATLEGCWHVVSPCEVRGNPTGAGDASAAAVARALAGGESLLSACCDAVALAAAAVAYPVAGEVDLALHAELRELVVPVQLEGI